MSHLFCIITLILATVGACQNGERYRLSSPDEKLILKKPLSEISGLEWLDNAQLAAVQDEKGVIFVLDSLRGDVSRELKFAKKGDFEGISFAHGDFYVLRSDGTIYRYNEAKSKTWEYKFKNDAGFDFEGLCNDLENNRLLVACKRHGDKKSNRKVWIYSFDLNKKKYHSKAAFTIPKKEIKTHKDFEPSGIAIDSNSDIYVLSSAANSLMVLSSSGDIKQTQHLEKTIFEQPEGITFDNEDRLMISNEKRMGSANILIFRPRNE